jgi:hypothetical protein
MTEREATDRLLGAIRAAAPLLRHGMQAEAVAVLEDAERAVRQALAILADAGRYGGKREGA